MTSKREKLMHGLLSLPRKKHLPSSTEPSPKVSPKPSPNVSPGSHRKHGIAEGLIDSLKHPQDKLTRPEWSKVGKRERKSSSYGASLASWHVDVDDSAGSGCDEKLLPSGSAKTTSKERQLSGDSSTSWHVEAGDAVENRDEETMLDDLNLTEDRKDKIRNLPDAVKNELMEQMRHQLHQTARPAGDTYSRYSAPTYVQCLRNHDHMPEKEIYKCISSLRVALTNNPLSWVQEFGLDGLQQVFSILRECYNNRYNQRDHIQYECIRCLKAIMNNKVGLKQLFLLKDSLFVLSFSIDPEQPHVMQESVRLMAAVCIIDGSRYDQALDAITLRADLKGGPRFEPIVKGLVIDSNDLREGCMQLVNAIISTPEELDHRLHLRNEFMHAGLGRILETLEAETPDCEKSSLRKQIQIFYKQKEEDSEKFGERFENVRLEFDDLPSCFELVKNMVSETPAEAEFLSILQYLVFIRDDVNVRWSYFSLIEQCVRQIVLHKSGCDPDFKTFEFDVGAILASIAEKREFIHPDSLTTEELQSKLDAALMQKTEFEARLAEAENRIKQLESGVVKTGLPSAPPGLSAALKTPPGHASSGVPVPPPPVPPSMGGGPPPPPLPPPPGAAPKVVALPFGMKEKQKYRVEAPVKKLNWSKVPPEKLSEKSFWVNVHEEKWASDDVFSCIQAQFCTKAPKKKVERTEATMEPEVVKKVTLLDSKSAYNMAIILHGLSKGMTYEDIKLCILRCDDSKISRSLLEQLIHYMPSPEEQRRVEQYKGDLKDLCEADRFTAIVGGIKRLVPRLNSMCFKLGFDENVQDLKPRISTTVTACEQLKSSKKFEEVLEIVLLIGNYMNTGTRNAQSLGFDISFLAKLSNTKDLNNNNSLMHLLVQTVEKKCPRNMAFPKDFSHIPRAAKVSSTMLKRELKQMQSCLQDLKKDVKNAAEIPQGENDLFAKVMGKFESEASKEVATLKSMLEKAESMYAQIAEYYAFDKSKYDMEDLFMDIAIFMEEFQEAKLKLIKDKEAEEKAARMKKMKEKAAREREERIRAKRSRIDMTTEGQQEGVMDDLLKALETGQAFARGDTRSG